MKYEVLKMFISNFLDFLFPPSNTWKEISQWQKEDVLQKCQKSNRTIPNSNSLFSYKDKYIKEMIWSIKFSGKRYFAKIFGELLYEEIKNIEGTLVPIPIHSKRKKERGFNQCEWLCEEIKKHDMDNKLIYKPKLLKRKVYKEKQSKSKRSDREKNTVGVFSVKEKIYGTVILIDDVITTGATTKEARRVLLESGIQEVLIYTIAH